MKICYLSNSAMPSKNASAIQIIKMCEAFSELKNDVILISTNSYENEENIFKYYNVRSKFNFVRMKKFKSFPLGFNYYLFSLLSILKSFNFKPDIYVTRNFFTCFLLVLFRKNTIIELHHGIDMESRIVKFLVKYSKFLNSKKIIKLLAITKNVKNYYSNNFNINKKKFLVAPSGSSISKNFYYKKVNKSFKIGYFGSLYKSRGFDLIVKLAQIDRINKYFIYGDIRNLKNKHFLKSIKNLHINNHIPYREIPNTIEKMDLLIMPYTSSITVSGDVGDITKFTSPLKLFDYLSSGKLILCSNFDVLKEVVKDKQNVIFIKNYKNIFAWKNVIGKLKYQNQKRFIISKNNYKLSKIFRHSQRAKKILQNILV